ncbi:MFS transporter [Aquipuribacter hungaricus]|uniref:MFS transporter n=3 Tax=Aquipuribacter hungaricus TaxID=545624 RepID=A0ABV7WI62_9MICO
MHTGTQASAAAPYLAFAAFGLFWGTWGAALPALRSAAALDDAALGTALLFVGLGALPAMLLTGRAVDRWGARAGGAALVALAVAGVVVAATGRDLATLCLAMALVGATSGAADVAANALAGLREQRSGGRVVTVAHGVFSSCVVVGSLGTGALRAAGADVVLVFCVAGTAMAVLGLAVLRLGDGPQAAAPGARTTGDGVPRDQLGALRPALPFVVVGLVGALGLAVENAHQSWGAVFLADEVGAGPGLTALAPATFAAAAAATRFAAGLLTGVPAAALLGGGAATALAGTLVVAASGSVGTALAGLVLAAVGTAVLFPTLLSRAVRDVPAARRGRATSTVATTAYLGFLAGPVYVGLLSQATGLRGAMVGVAALVAVVGVLAPLTGRARRQERVPPVVRAGY